MGRPNMTRGERWEQDVHDGTADPLVFHLVGEAKAKAKWNATAEWTRWDALLDKRHGSMTATCEAAAELRLTHDFS